MKVFRIAQASWAGSAREMMSGDGAAEWGGRWNSPGVPAVYCSETLSLAALELLVHLPPEALGRYCYLEIEIPDSMVRVVSVASTEIDDRLATQARGDKLLAPGGPLAFAVPSKVNPREKNVVVNPHHPDFGLVAFDEPRPFPIDERLIRRS